jgi:hypothetical protein
LRPVLQGRVTLKTNKMNTIKKKSLAALVVTASLLVSFSVQSGSKRSLGEAGAIASVKNMSAISHSLEEESCLPNVARWIRQMVENVLEAVNTRTCEPESPTDRMARLQAFSARKMEQL